MTGRHKKKRRSVSEKRQSRPCRQCSGPTTWGKHYCLEHLDQNKGAARALGVINDRAADVDRISARKLDVLGPVAQEFFSLAYDVPVTISELMHKTGLDADTVRWICEELYARRYLVVDWSRGKVVRCMVRVGVKLPVPSRDKPDNTTRVCLVEPVKQTDDVGICPECMKSKPLGGATGICGECYWGSRGRRKQPKKKPGPKRRDTQRRA